MTAPAVVARLRLTVVDHAHAGRSTAADAGTRLIVNQVIGSSRTMAADADIVLNTAADSTRAPAWLPASDTTDYELDLKAADRRVDWRPAGHDGWTGHLRVTDHGAGSSEAELRVEVDDQADAAEVRKTLDDALRALAAEVDQNFNVS
jgi:hypothetical protein